mmetsp:Transcript_7831/g.7304  ORF Transcript_7831/g.7304 Transcript_7831/m.7304 type:complete len:105 (+) Transcript_7831:820-1134(+)
MRSREWSLKQYSVSSGEDNGAQQDSDEDDKEDPDYDNAINHLQKNSDEVFRDIVNGGKEYNTFMSQSDEEEEAPQQDHFCEEVDDEDLDEDEEEKENLTAYSTI